MLFFKSILLFYILRQAMSGRLFNRIRGRIPSTIREVEEDAEVFASGAKVHHLQPPTPPDEADLQAQLCKSMQARVAREAIRAQMQGTAPGPEPEPDIEYNTGKKYPHWFFVNPTSDDPSPVVFWRGEPTSA